MKNQLRPLSDFQGSMAQRVYESLKDAILTLMLEPGEFLRKPDICIALGVSRSQLSEALAKLALDDLVLIVPQAGTYVAKISMDEIREAAFLRQALELAAISRITKHITDHQLQLVSRNLRVQEFAAKDRDHTQFYQLDTEFHEMILSFTGFRRIAGLAQSSWLHVNRARKLLLPKSGRLEETLQEHQNIIVALEARNTELAIQQMSYHLNQIIEIMEKMYLDTPDLFQTNKGAIKWRS